MSSGSTIIGANDISLLIVKAKIETYKTLLNQSFFFLQALQDQMRYLVIGIIGMGIVKAGWRLRQRMFPLHVVS